ncbi:EmrB/QacA subfamily drug resistance transporter [Saccharothrix tamanrassetensis]|uniref:EmrB/QacA subfamily drug resistance transporter n=1 Tax=Saccharothrix tamanrassetensis TaxID=1051531 RepID=A0A841CS68_9PSEU|nr:MFS transporter [Saccharothrix tamanrassetensis]MBB5960100.1 EmrB/QacA subfamily drug resistance transporter [Saccharothrix tamanrassetensis]
MNPDPRRWWALAVLAAAQFMVIMDTSIIAVALPDMQRELGFTSSGLQWVFNAYAVALGGLLLLGGRLSDLWGARRVFAAGWATLIAGSVLAAAATDAGTEVAGRAVQGVGAALIAPAAMTLLMVLFAGQPAELPRAMAFYGAAAPAGGTAGVFLGGVITEWLSWPWVFIVYVPIGLLTLALTPRLLPAVPGRRGGLDLGGAVAVTGGLALAVYAIVLAPERGWTSAATLAQLAAAVVLLAAFLLVQRAARNPLMPLQVWRTPDLAAANVAMALLGAAWIPMWYFLNLYVQHVLGFDAFASGAALLPMTALMTVLMTTVTGRLIGRFGTKPLIVTGLVVLAVGLGLLATADADGSFVADVLPGSLVAAVGMALVFIPATIGAITGVAPEQGGLASGIVNTTYQVGSALGLAAMTALATSRGAEGSADGYSAAFTGAALVALVGAGLAAVTLGRVKSVEHV